MSWAHLIAIGVLFGSGTYLVLQRNLTRVLVGLGMVGAWSQPDAAVRRRSTGLGSDTRRAARPFSDPIPQALILTAIVISFAVTAFLLALAVRAWGSAEDDVVEDDLEDRRIASTSGGGSR